MESKTSDIIKFIIENPTMKQSDIARTFNTSRQWVSQIVKNRLNPDEKKNREQIKNDQIVEQILPLVEVGASMAVISALTGLSIHNINSAYSDPKIQEVLKKHEDIKMDKIEALSHDWLNKMSIPEIIVKHEIKSSSQSIAGMISVLRKTYPDKFPLRIHNQESPVEKYERYVELKNQGIPAEEIATMLAYRNVQSMKSSFNQI